MVIEIFDMDKTISENMKDMSLEFSKYIPIETEIRVKYKFFNCLFVACLNKLAILGIDFSELLNDALKLHDKVISEVLNKKPK